MGEPIKIDTVDKWIENTNNGEVYMDDNPDKPKNNGLDDFKVMLENKGFDIFWNVRKVSTFTKSIKEFNHIFINRRISRISKNNIHYPVIIEFIDNI